MPIFGSRSMRMERPLTELADAIVAEVARRLANRRPPRATYRLQFHPRFGLRDAARLVPYLAALGVSHLYASPFFRAKSDSTHGYDVVDHAEIDPRLGGEAGLEELVRSLREHGMGLILDFVPNHMGIGSENAYWQDVLENGPSSVHARFFDIVWEPLKDELKNKVLLPILGDQYGAVLEAGELQLDFADGGFWVRYYEHRFPINPRHYPMILEHRIEALQEDGDEAALDLEELLSICTACHNLPPRTETDPERIQERRREKEVIKRRLEKLCEESPRIREHVERNLHTFNGIPGEPRSFDLLDALLDAQAYRLAHWQVAGEEINYRRFFDINDLAAIRMEDPQVFEKTHAKTLELLARGWVDGLRIDHPDGLFDPEGYFARLQREHFLDLARAECERLAPSVPFEAVAPLLRAAWTSDERIQRPIYIVAEKILVGNESIPQRWAIDGTSGYDFLCRVTGIFVDPRGRKPLDDFYVRFTGVRQNVGELLYEKKKLIINTSMASEVNILAYRLNRISERNRRSRDFTLNALRSALIEYIACFPVYRTYITPSRIDDADRNTVELAIARAKRRSPVTNVTIFDFLRDILLLRPVGDASAEERKEQIDFAMKVQQLTGPVMAKGLEDTTFYVYNRLLALNEVGCDPSAFGISLEEFHASNLARRRGSLLATSTHDTKRSEDARARLLVLSEIPDAWKELVLRLSRIARKHRVAISEDRVAPDRNEEYFLYQSLLAAWPLEEMDEIRREEFAARMEAYAVKAAKEAKVNTSWVNPDTAWDEALTTFVRRIVHDDEFLAAFSPFFAWVSEAGIRNSLAQALLKFVSPGVPDIYQGCERFNFSLVDPDNRRPVDFEALAASLRWMQEHAADRTTLCTELWAHRRDGRIKQYLTARALELRRREEDLFARGEYLPLEFAGPRREHAIGVCRRLGPRSVIAVVPRFIARLLDEADPWKDTHLLLPRGTGGAPWRDWLTGASFRPQPLREHHGLALSSLFATLPVALLVSGDHQGNG